MMCTSVSISRRAVCLAGLLAAAAAWGCSAGGGAAAVDAPRARDALKTTLDSWKKGDAPSALKDGSPSIIAQDLDWLAGAKLVDYQVAGEGKEKETNLYVPVTLTLQNPQGKEIKKSVSYVVATSPHISVFRDVR
jgi:hypothetical protein